MFKHEIEALKRDIFETKEPVSRYMCEYIFGLLEVLYNENEQLRVLLEQKTLEGLRNGKTRTVETTA